MRLPGFTELIPSIPELLMFGANALLIIIDATMLIAKEATATAVAPIAAVAAATDPYIADKTMEAGIYITQNSSSLLNPNLSYFKSGLFTILLIKKAAMRPSFLSACPCST